MSLYKLSEKQLNNQRFYEYRTGAVSKLATLINWNVSDFDYKIAPRSSWIERYLINDGMVCLTDKFNTDGNPEFIRCSMGSGLDKWGENTHVFGITSTETKELEIGKDCAVFYNNSTRTPDIFTINRLSQMLTDNDLSLRLCVVNSRNIPIPLAMNDTQKAEFKTALEDMQKGKSTIIKSFGIDEAHTLNITDINAVDKIQAHSRLYDELLRRFFNNYGVEISTKDKGAQVNNAELDAFDKYTMIGFYDRLNARREGLKLAKELYNIDLRVEPSPLFEDDDTDDDGVKDKEESEGAENE